MNTPRFCHLPASDRMREPEEDIVQWTHEKHRQKWGSEKTHKHLRTMLEKDMLLWNSFNSLENIFSVESGGKRHLCHTEFYFHTFFSSSVEKTVWFSLMHSAASLSMSRSENKTVHSDAASDRKGNQLAALQIRALALKPQIDHDWIYFFKWKLSFLPYSRGH